MLQGWDNFFAVAGAAAATLIGLMFVAVSLGADIAQTPKARGANAFVTPIVAHFGAVLLDSLALLAPWPSPVAPGAILALSGAAGAIYAALVGLKMRRFEFVQLDWFDVHFYASVPCLANLCLVGGACGLMLHAPYGPYAVAASVLLLLLVAIRNAWDVALWIARNREAG